MQQIFTYLFAGIYVLSILSVLAVVITENRNPLKTLPWILVLMLAPVAGLVCYFFFGQNLSKRRVLSRRMRKRITQQLEEAPPAGTPGIPDRYAPLAALLRNTSNAIPLYGSRITPYTDGQSKMEALMADIARARHHIHIQYYILSDDATGRRLRDGVIAKAREGVEVRILYDDVGSRAVGKEFFASLRREGVEVQAFLHVQFPRFASKVNYRNHRKTVVIDGRIGYIGGMNIADRYLYGLPWGSWRDSHFRIEGSGATGLQASFLSDWSASTKQQIEGPAYYPPANPAETAPTANPTETGTAPAATETGAATAPAVNPAETETGPATAATTATTSSGNILQIAPTGPFGKWRALLQADSYAIARARRRVWVQTPYYLPADVLNTALQEAALAGIDVRLMLPERSDSRVVDLASRSYLNDMLRAGVKVLFYTPGFLHAKMLLIDDELTVIGSANMDFRSFEHNFEISAFVYDAAFNARMAELFSEDSRRCRQLTGEWFRRPRRVRLAESFMRLFAPLL